MQDKATSQKPAFFLDLFWITLFASLFFFLLLGSRPLLSPDGGRYAEIAREMIAANDFLTPRLNGILYFQKPPLYYWLLALVMSIWDSSFLALRSVNALLGIFGLYAVYTFTRWTYGYQTARLAAAITACNALYFGMVNIVNLDLSVAVFMNACLFCFYFSTRARNALFYLLLSAFFAALATLTKGFIGFVLPGLILFLWLTVTRRLSFLISKKWAFLAAFTFFLALTLPWHLLIQHRHPEFFQFYFLDQHVTRYVSPSFEHQEPFWYLGGALFFLFLPWSIFLVHTAKQTVHDLKKTAETRDAALLLVLTVLVIFFFFSCSQSKLISYILPLVPALSILTARCFSKICPRVFLTALVFAVMMLIASLYWIGKHDQRSTLPIAEYLQKHAKKEDFIAHYHKFYHDLPFYMNQIMNVVEWKNELRYGIEHQDAPWMMHEEVFWKKWNSETRVWVILETDEFNRFREHPSPYTPAIFYRDSNKLLISNQGNS